MPQDLEMCMRPLPENFHQCEDCKALITPGFGIHYCVTEYRNGKAVRGVTKYYNHTTKVWEVQPSQGEKMAGDVARGIATYDTKKGEWITAEDGYEVASCEIPPKIVSAVDTATPSSNPYKPCEPWEGLNRVIWPNTWQTLVMIHHDKGWYGRYITNEEYRDRIHRGIYKPEVKYHPVNEDWRGGYSSKLGPQYGSKKPEETPTSATGTKPQDEDDAGNPYGYTHWSDYGEG